MKCAKHHRKEAIGACVSCGSGVCKECRIAVQGITYCKSCLEGGKMQPSPPLPPGPLPRTRPPRRIRAPRQVRVPRSTRRPFRLFFIIAAIGMIFLVLALSIYTYFQFVSFWLGGYQSTNIFCSAYLLVTCVIAGIGFFGYWWNYGLRSSLVAFFGTLILSWWLMLGEILLGMNVSFIHLVIRDIGIAAFGVVLELWSSAIGEVSLFDINEWLTRTTKILLSISALMFFFSSITGLASDFIIAPGPIEFAIWFRGVMVLLLGVASLFLVLGCIISIVILVSTKYGLERTQEETPSTTSS